MNDQEDYSFKKKFKDALTDAVQTEKKKREKEIELIKGMIESIATQSCLSKEMQELYIKKIAKFWLDPGLRKIIDRELDRHKL